MTKEQRRAVIWLVLWAILITATLAKCIAREQYWNILVYISGALAGGWVPFFARKLAK